MNYFRDRGYRGRSNGFFFWYSLSRINQDDEYLDNMCLCCSIEVGAYMIASLHILNSLVFMAIGLILAVSSSAIVDMVKLARDHMLSDKDMLRVKDCKLIFKART